MNQIQHNGQTVELLSTNKGWSTIKLPDGSEKKVRGALLNDGAKRPAKKAGKKAAKSAAEKKQVKKDAKVRKTIAPEDRKNGVVNPVYLDRYTKVVLADGTAVRDVGDAAAKAMRGKNLDDLYRLASEKTGKTQKDLKDAYADRNPGMQRMTLGNMIRAAMKPKSEKAKADKPAAKAKKGGRPQ